MQQAFEQLDQVIQRSRNVVLTTHISPDGDGLGSEVALAAYLKGLGKTAAILNHSALPSMYDFLDTGRTILQYNDAQYRSTVESADTILVVDTNHPDRLAGMKEAVLASKATKVIIDHHLDPDPFADFNVIDASASATGLIIFQFLSSRKNFSFSKEIATALYVAIMTDTGSFRFPKTDGTLHRAVASLIDAGADPVQIYQDVYERAPLNRVRLLGMVLSNLKTAHNGQVAYLSIPRSLFIETGTTEVDTDNFVPYALGLKGVRIGLMFTEMDGFVKISFRSRGDIWVNKLAQEFGGNGHKNAAGARIAGGDLASVVAEVLEHSKRYL